jgi:starch-binding outer membrane protein, SusD/RagB family
MKKLNIFKRRNKTTCTIISILFLGTITFSSCKFLELESPDGVLQENVFSSADGFRSARIGMYAAMGNKDYYGGTFPLAIDAHSDNSTNGGYSNTSYDELGTLKSVTPSNLIVEKMWLAMYSPINISNQILANINNLDEKNFDEGEKNNIKAEALFVRALCHFDALRTWGEHWDSTSIYGIPVITTPQSFDRVTPRGTVADNYKAIIDDLLQSKELITGSQKTFVNAVSVDALLARVYLYRQDNVNAALTAEKIITDAGTNALYAAIDYTKIFTTKESKESIFELGFTNQSRSAFNQLTYVRPDASRSEILFFASADLGSFFEKRPNDVRAKFVNFTDNDPSISPDGRTEKYRGEQTKDNPAYILRLAEQYLIAAEANGKTKGLAHLNTLRKSRGMSVLAANISSEDFATAVADERRAEFNMEGHRYFDLARTNKIEDVMGKDVKSNFPIPLREITATNGAIIQNKGY